MLRNIFGLLLAAAFVAGCATSDQNTPNKQNLGEGDKRQVQALFDSVATTEDEAKLKDGEDTRGGKYAEPVTYQEVVEEPYEVRVPVLDENGAPVIIDGEAQFVTETRVKRTVVVRPVLGPDGKPIYRKANGFRNLVLNYGTISQSQTSSGESQGSVTATQNPASTPTNTPTVNPNLNLPAGGPGN